MRKQSFIQGRVFGRRGNMIGASLAYRMGARSAMRASHRRNNRTRLLRQGGTRSSYMTGGYNPYWLNGRRYLHYRHRWQIYFNWTPGCKTAADLSALVMTQQGTVDPAKLMRVALLPPDSPNFAFVPFEDHEAPDNEDYPTVLEGKLKRDEFIGAAAAIHAAIHSQDDDEGVVPWWLILCPPCFCVNLLIADLCCKASHDAEVAQKVQQAVTAACSEWNHKLKWSGLSVTVVDQEGVEGLAFFATPYTDMGEVNPHWTGEVPAMSESDKAMCQTMIKLACDPSAPPPPEYEALLDQEAQEIVSKEGDEDPLYFDDALKAYDQYSASLKPATAPAYQESAVVMDESGMMQYGMAMEEDPSPLPVPWQELYDTSMGYEEPYYHNPQTGVTQWERPKGPPPPPPPPPPRP